MLPTLPMRAFGKREKHFWPIAPNNNLKLNVAISCLKTGHRLGNKIILQCK